MSLYRGLDSAAVPGPLTRAAAKAQGVRWWGGYLGGPDAAAAWTASDFATLLADGFAILGIYVPAQQATLGHVPGVAAAMASMASAVGLPAGHVLALDAEPVLAAWLGANPSQVDALASSLQTRGYSLALYGDPSAGPATGGAVRWLAQWPGTSSWPSALPAGDADWQWAGTTSPVAGTDADICDQALFDMMWQPAGSVPQPAPAGNTAAPKVPVPSSRQLKLAGQWITVQDAPIPLGEGGGGWLDFDIAWARIVAIVAYGDVRAWVTGIGPDKTRIDVAGGPTSGYVTVAMLLADA